LADSITQKKLMKIFIVHEPRGFYISIHDLLYIFRGPYDFTCKFQVKGKEVFTGTKIGVIYFAEKNDLDNGKIAHFYCFLSAN
jgi:hypothetical protein